jgi:hypothetical protein
MPGIPRDVAEHSLDIRAGARPVKQPLRRFDEEKRRVIGEEIHKLKEAKSVKLNPEKHPEPLLGVPGGCTPPPGKTACHRRRSGARNVQAGRRSRRGLRQRLERPTATLLLPLRCFQAARIPRSHTSLNRQGRVGLASAEPDPPSGAKKGEPLRVKIGCTSPHPKFSTKKGFCVLPAMSEAGSRGANVGACKWRGRLSRGTPMPPG